jgi:ribA/ribD-fused uncharacterized protein
MNHFNRITGQDGQELFLFENGWCPLSSHYPSSVVLYNVRYRSAQQMYQAMKAKHFGDLTAYRMIMKCWSSKTQSEIASTIDNFKPEEWQKKASSVMEKAMRLRFVQNAKDRDYLLETGNAAIVFASRFQTFWGNGLDMQDERNKDTSQWQGKNELGTILMRLRQEFKEDAAGKQA